MSHNCQVETCDKQGSFRCSRCHAVYYCGVAHQRSDWTKHKVICKTQQTAAFPSNNVDNNVVKKEESSRICRCMFCGEELLIGSEEEAVNHMRVCTALQEQLQSKDQFTIPSMLKEKMK